MAKRALTAKQKIKTRTKRSSSSAAKVAAYRVRMRKKGMKLVQVWVPDVHARGFAEEACRQARSIANSAGEKEDMTFIDSISWLNEN